MERIRTHGLWGWHRSSGSWRFVFSVSIATTLPLMLMGQFAFAKERVKGAKGSSSVSELQSHERVLHALNRLTFGPRPGDVAAVEAMGLKRWFAIQLDPAAIDDSKLEEKLSQYPAIRLPIAELERKYPGPQRIKAIVNGRALLPSDPTERAFAIDEIEIYKARRAKRESAAKTGTALPALSKMSQVGERADSGAKMQDATLQEATYWRGYSTSFAALPPELRMKRILAMAPADLATWWESLDKIDLERISKGLSVGDREMLTALGGSLRMVSSEAEETRLLRDVCSERQLEAVMTDFWLNHFNVYVRKNENEPYFIPAYERETIRPHALGNFEELLVANAKSPAMLDYLDNFRSIGPNSPTARRKKPGAPDPGLNENYGRELMELHTLGVNGGYTQKDVTEVAKVFTGWTIEKPLQGSAYLFDEKRHEPGTKIVLGKLIREGGEAEGVEVLHLLATNPATAHFISEKLAIRFVSDAPSPTLVDRMAKSFLRSHGDIKTVLRTMFRSPEFWSVAVYRAKVKTPLEFEISAVRASGLEVETAQALVRSLDRLGMPIYGMQTPNGYSAKQEDWVNTGALVNRMNFALVMSGGKLQGTRTSWTQVLAASAKLPPMAFAGSGEETSAKVKERKLEEILLGQSVSDHTRATVLGHADDGKVTEQAEVDFDLQSDGRRRGSLQDDVSHGKSALEDRQAATMAGLLIGSPEFQRR